MNLETKPRKLRIVTGPVAEVEDELNRLLDEYNAIVWSFHECAGVAWASVVLLHESVFMQQALAQPGVMRRN
jgi:hypothetical protein